MLHYKERKNRIHILTLDHVLAEDVYERLRGYLGMESAEIIKPGDGHSAITPESILQSARDTLTSRILIIDVRRQTKPMLQGAYSDIVRFNRPDFNSYCYSVLIGDGPTKPSDGDKGINDARNYLSNLRIDFSPAVFFVDPFLYYSYEETQEMALYRNFLPEQIPQRLRRYFKENMPSTSQVYRYFRAADAPDYLKQIKKKGRQDWLRSLFIKIISKEFPDNKDILIKGLSKEGSSLPGEPLKLNIYPFFFEEWVLDLINKFKTTTGGG